MILSVILQIVQGADSLVQKSAEAVQTLTETTGQQFQTLSLWELTKKGGVVMIPIAILLVIAIYVFIERYITANRAAKTDSGFMTNIKNYIKDGKIESAINLCRSNHSPMARLIEKGISRIGRPLSDVTSAIENEGKLQVAKLEKGVTFLSAIASIGPMIGFLGTVTGMINAFYKLSTSGNNIDISILSGGIYEAMITTVGGLIVGIIAAFSYNVIVARIERVVYNLEAHATEFMDILNEPA